MDNKAQAEFAKASGTEGAGDPALPARPPVARYWWMALSLGLVAPGLGYVYLGRPRRAGLIALGALILLAAIYHGAWGVMGAPYVTFAVLAVVLVAWVGVAADNIRIARAEPMLAPRRYNRLWVYALAGLTWLGLANVDDISGGDIRRAVRAFSVPSGTMAPTLRAGEAAIADMRAYDAREPRRGDVILYTLDTDALNLETIYMKRLIGFPGDQIQMKAGRLYINGVAVPVTETGTARIAWAGRGTAPVEARVRREVLPEGREIATYDTETNGPLDDTPEYLVPPGHYFVLGDNRDNSVDSRQTYAHGYVARGNIRGRVNWVYWSPDWARIGARMR